MVELVGLLDVRLRHHVERGHEVALRGLGRRQAYGIDGDRDRDRGRVVVGSNPHCRAVAAGLRVVRDDDLKV
jgi:hypothetical protein